MEFTVEVEPGAEKLCADLDAICQVLTNLMENSLRHTPAGGTIACLARRQGNGVAIAVRDNGAGGADPDGHGLVGMRDRVTTLGGRLEIESPADGGTLVAATLPLSAG